MKKGRLKNASTLLNYIKLYHKSLWEKRIGWTVPLNKAHLAIYFCQSAMPPKVSCFESVIDKIMAKFWHQQYRNVFGMSELPLKVYYTASQLELFSVYITLPLFKVIFRPHQVTEIRTFLPALDYLFQYEKNIFSDISFISNLVRDNFSMSRSTP